MSDKLNKKVKKKWIKALRSGKYNQGRHGLKVTKTYYIVGNNGQRFKEKHSVFCCLGVLCDISRKELGIKWNEGVLGKVHAFPPKEVIVWAGLEPKQTRDDLLGAWEFQPPLFQKLAEMNDSGASFAKIAKVIEEEG